MRETVGQGFFVRMKMSTVTGTENLQSWTLTAMPARPITSIVKRALTKSVTALMAARPSALMARNGMAVKKNGRSLAGHFRSDTPPPPPPCPSESATR
jgi:hypothetical protein